MDVSGLPVLQEDDLAEVLEELRSTEAKWKSIGIHLKLRSIVVFGRDWKRTQRWYWRMQPANANCMAKKQESNLEIIGRGSQEVISKLWRQSERHREDWKSYPAATQV